MKKLKQVLAQEDTVLFIGSGISLWSGLPSWGRLIEELAQFIESNGGNTDIVRAEAQKGDLLQAASYGFDKLTKPQIGEFIKKACHYGIAKPHEIHQKIVSLEPRCFVTTNYDDLIEQSLRIWQSDRFFRSPVTNRHLTETADIVHARAIDYIFKPHGDAADSESIILTREQYRQLLPQGERHGALKALEMVLASRPVVYLGFGLRDPDFIYVRDLLANTYKGGTRDHYAIMADVSDTETDYWRRNYGIHLVSYATTERLDKTRDHTALLTLLDSLLEKAPVIPAMISVTPQDSEVLLTLARHAAALARTPKQSPEFQIRVHTETKHDMKRDIHSQSDKFDHYPVDKFLDNGPERALLIGLPGAGKTYSLHQAVARLAEQLHTACLMESFDENSVVVPIFVDLKLYRGDLGELVNQMLPKTLQLDELTRLFKVKIFLDSFNEMPREYWESGSYEADFTTFISRVGNSSFVIGSRTSDGLDKLGLPTYSLDQIDEATVTTELKNLGIELEGRFDHEVLWLLQRPFYFRYILNRSISLPKEAHPREFYKAFFENIRNTFVSRFNGKLDIEKVLSLAAYDALNLGEEAFPLTNLLRVLKTSVESLDVADIDVHDVANWLVSSSVLIPYTGGRVAFVHQSVTEYLAATELARRYLSSPHILREKLSLTRWDQSLFLTLSLLPSAQADMFFKDVIKADFALALTATKYLEVGRDEVISKLLSEIREHIQDSGIYNWKIESAIKSGLPVTEVHEQHLRTLIKYGNSLGSAAASRLIALKGIEVKDELLQLLFNCPSDFNFCNGIGRALKSFATDSDVQKIAVWADSIQDTMLEDSDNDKTNGFTSGAAEFLAELDLSVIHREFLPSDESMQIPKIRAEILCDILRDHYSTTALNLAGELLLRGVNEAVFALYCIANFAKPDNPLSWEMFSADHVVRLLSLIDESDESWGINALSCLCAARPDLAELVKRKASKKFGIEKAVLLYCVSPTDLTPVFLALSELIEMSDEERCKEPLRLLKRIDFDWIGQELLFIKLLKLRDMELAFALFGGSCPVDLPNLGKLEIGSIQWWLDWMLEVVATDQGYWFVNQLGSVFAEHLSDEDQDKFIAEFNKSDSKFRRLLLRIVLPFRKDITTEAFSEDAISFILADLNREGNVSFYNGHLLSNTATEQFITERLLPLLPDAKQPLLKNLHSILRQAGSRHGKRYIFDD